MEDFSASIMSSMLRGTQERVGTRKVLEEEPFCMRGGDADDDDEREEWGKEEQHDDVFSACVPGLPSNQYTRNPPPQSLSSCTFPCHRKMCDDPSHLYKPYTLNLSGKGEGRISKP